MMGKVFALFLLLIGVLSGCSFPSEQEYEENVSLKIVNSGVKIE